MDCFSFYYAQAITRSSIEVHITENPRAQTAPIIPIYSEKYNLWLQSLNWWEEERIFCSADSLTCCHCIYFLEPVIPRKPVIQALISGGLHNFRYLNALPYLIPPKSSSAHETQFLRNSLEVRGRWTAAMNWDREWSEMTHQKWSVRLCANYLLRNTVLSVFCFLRWWGSLKEKR